MMELKNTRINLRENRIYKCDTEVGPDSTRTADHLGNDGYSSTALLQYICVNTK